MNADRNDNPSAICIPPTANTRFYGADSPIPTEVFKIIVKPVTFRM